MQYQVQKGQKLGNYIIDDFLGKGGFANVYLATHSFFKTRAAIKVLNERGLQETMLEQFLDEARKLKDLNHPHIIKILDFGVENDPTTGGSIAYLVMDYAPLGPITKKYPRKTRVPVAAVVQYIKQVADALQSAHDHQPSIVHLDVKPENILLMSEQQAVLSDFGIAVSGMATENLQFQKDRLAEREARKEQILFRGTPAYMAPEYWQGHTQRATDQYALGVMAYEWLSGHQPFIGNADEVYKQHIFTSPPTFWRSFSDIPPEVEQAVMKALAKKPEDRFKRVMDFALALEKAADPVLRPSMVYRAVPTPPPAQPSTSWAPTAYPGQGGQPPTQPANPVQQTQVSQPQRMQPPPPQTQMNQAANMAVPPTPSYAPTTPQGTHSIQQPVHLASSVPPQWQAQGQATFANSQTIWGPPPDPASAIPNRGQATNKLSNATTFMDDLKGSLHTLHKAIQRVITTDDYFLRTYRNRRFFFLDIVLNLFLTIPVFFTGSPVLGVFGLVLSYILFWYCSLSVKKWVAILFGGGLALWWGYSVSTLLQSRFHQSSTTSWISFLVVLLLGLGRHFWYVQNRIKA